MKLSHAQQNIISLAKDFIEAKWPLLIEGETGIGKNFLVERLAEESSKKIIRINLNINVAQEDLWGQNIIVKDGEASVLKFKEGPIVTAIKNGYWLLLDEINAALPEVLFSLHALLERNKPVLYIPIIQEELPVHEDFRVIATMNPSDEYFGTRTLNQAFVSRFMKLEMKSPSLPEIADLLNDFYPAMKKEIGNALTFLAFFTAECAKWNVGIKVSFRDFEKMALLARYKDNHLMHEQALVFFKDYVNQLPEDGIQEIVKGKIPDENYSAMEIFMKNPAKYTNLIKLLESEGAARG